MEFSVSILNRLTGAVGALLAKSALPLAAMSCPSGQPGGTDDGCDDVAVAAAATPDPSSVNAGLYCALCAQGWMELSVSILNRSTGAVGALLAKSALPMAAMPMNRMSATTANAVKLPTAPRCSCVCVSLLRKFVLVLSVGTMLESERAKGPRASALRSSAVANR